MSKVFSRMQPTALREEEKPLKSVFPSVKQDYPVALSIVSDSDIDKIGESLNE